jgi:hypothetical protein
MEKTEQRREQSTGKGIPQGAPISPGEHLSARSRPMDRKKDAGKENERNTVSVRYADGEYAAEQPQGLPAVIAELTRWAAQNLELTLKSEINVGSRLSEKRRLKRRITKCNKGRTKRLREGRSESIRMEEKREIFEPASSKQQRLFSRSNNLRLALKNKQLLSADAPLISK